MDVLPPATIISNNLVRRNAAILALPRLTGADTLHKSISTQKTATQLLNPIKNGPFGRPRGNRGPPTVHRVVGAHAVDVITQSYWLMTAEPNGSKPECQYNTIILTPLAQYDCHEPV